MLGSYTQGELSLVCFIRMQTGPGFTSFVYNLCYEANLKNKIGISNYIFIRASAVVSTANNGRCIFLLYILVHLFNFPLYY